MPKLLEEMEQVLNDIRDEDYKLRERGFEVFELLKDLVERELRCPGCGGWDCCRSGACVQ